MEKVFRINLLALSGIDWPTYSSILITELGYNPIRELDEIGLTTSDPCAFMSSLEGMDNPVMTMKHVFVSFLITTDHDASLIAMPGLPMIKQDNIYIVSGNLYDWFNFVNRFSVSNVAQPIRIFANSVMILLRNKGFNIWNTVAKSELPDGTFTLK